MLNKRYFEGSLETRKDLSVSGITDIYEKINLKNYTNLSSDGDIWWNGNELFFTSGSTDVDLLNKIGKVTGATGNIPKFDSNGEILDSGIEAIQEEFDLIDFITLSGISTNTNSIIPENYRIVSIVFEELSGNNAGDISVSTSTGGNDIVSGETVNSNELIDSTLLKTIFSTTDSTTIYIESTDWGNSSVNVFIRIEKFRET